MMNLSARTLFRSARPVSVTTHRPLNYIARSVVTLKEVKVVYNYQLAKSPAAFLTSIPPLQLQLGLAAMVESNPKA